MKVRHDLQYLANLIIALFLTLIIAITFSLLGNSNLAWIVLFFPFFISLSYYLEAIQLFQLKRNYTTENAVVLIQSNSDLSSQWNKITITYGGENKDLKVGEGNKINSDDETYTYYNTGVLHYDISQQIEIEGKTINFNLPEPENQNTHFKWVHLELFLKETTFLKEN